MGVGKGAERGRHVAAVVLIKVDAVAKEDGVDGHLKDGGEEGGDGVGGKYDEDERDGVVLQVVAGLEPDEAHKAGDGNNDDLAEEDEEVGDKGEGKERERVRREEMEGGPR